MLRDAGTELASCSDTSQLRKETHIHSFSWKKQILPPLTHCVLAALRDMNASPMFSKLVKYTEHMSQSGSGTAAGGKRWRV